MARKARFWLAAGTVGALLGIVLWRNPPALHVRSLGAEPAAETLSRPADIPATSASGRRAQARPEKAARVEAFNALKLRAEAGDRVAQRLLAETYADCYFVNLDREAFMSSLDVKKQLLGDTNQKRVLEQATRERIARCDAVEGGGQLEPQLAAYWYGEAAKRGDLAARAMVRGQELSRHDPIVTARLLEEVLASEDPAAVFHFGITLRVDDALNSGSPTEALATGAMASWAWIVAGCRMGYDCGPASRVMESNCLEVNGCTGEDLDAYVRNELPTDADRKDLERRVTEILRLVEGQ